MIALVPGLCILFTYIDQQSLSLFEFGHKKTCLQGCILVRLKPACSDTEPTQTLETSNMCSITRKLVFGVAEQVQHKQAAQPLKMARVEA